MIIVLAFVQMFSVLVSALERRDSVPTPISFPLAFAPSGQYVLGMTMSLNQSFGMAISTSTGDVVVAGTNCTSCGGVPSFNISTSSTAHLVSPSVQNSTLLQGSVSGAVITDTCGLLKSDGSLWSYPNQTIIVANNTNLPLSSNVSGVFGLGTKGFNGQLSDTVFGSWFARHPNATNFTYGMALNPPEEGSAKAGFLHWTAPDPSAYSGEVSYHTTVQSNSSILSSEWLIQLSQWDFYSSSTSTSNKVGGIALIDPFYSDIFIPQHMSRQIFTNIPGAIPHSSSTSEGWLLPCSTKMTFTVHFGSLKLKVDQKALVKSVNGSCYSTLVGWADPANDAYLLGSNFISASYLVFVISFLSPNLIGFASRPSTSSSGLSAGAIVGIALGAVALLAVVGCLIWLCVRRKNREGSSLRGHIRPFLLHPLFGGKSDPTHSNSEMEQPFSNLPSPQFTSYSHSGTDRPVTVSIQRTTENMGASSNHASIPTLPPITLSSPGSEEQTFAIEPFEVPPPPYPPVSVQRTGDSKRT